MGSSMKMLVLGAGLQGCACAYDLLQNPAVSQVTLADLRPDNLPPFLARGRLGAAGSAGAARRDRSGRGPGDAPRPRGGHERHSLLLQRRPWPGPRSRRAATSPISAAIPRSCSSRRSSHEQARGPERLGDPRLRARAGHGQHPGRGGHPPARPGRAGQDLRRRAAAAARAAAQLPDRLFARRRARLLHHAVVGAARRPSRCRWTR